MSTIIDLEEGTAVASQYKTKVFVSILDKEDTAVVSSTSVTDILLFNILAELKKGTPDE